MHPVDTPFNFEKVWFEDKFLNKKWRYGFSKKEIFTNYDDDNGYYGESLIKRGLYPFDNKYFLEQLKERKDLLSEFKLDLKKDEIYDCTYFSRKSRINACPVLSIQVLFGEIKLNSKNEKFILSDQNKIYVYSNVFPKLKAITDCRVKISIFDEIIK